MTANQKRMSSSSPLTLVIAVGFYGAICLLEQHDSSCRLCLFRPLSCRWCSKDPLDRFLGASLLCTTGYMHWAQSHLAHHVKVRLRMRRCALAGSASPLFSLQMLSQLYSLVNKPYVTVDSVCRQH